MSVQLLSSYTPAVQSLHSIIATVHTAWSSTELLEGESEAFRDKIFMLINFIGVILSTRYM